MVDTRIYVSRPTLVPITVWKIRDASWRISYLTPQGCAHGDTHNVSQPTLVITCGYSGVGKSPRRVNSESGAAVRFPITRGQIHRAPVIFRRLLLESPFPLVLL